MSTHGHVVGLVFCHKITELVKEIFDPIKLAEDLSLVLGDLLRQQLETRITLLETRLQEIGAELIADLSLRSSL